MVYNALLPGGIADSYERENRDTVFSISENWFLSEMWRIKSSFFSLTV